MRRILVCIVITILACTSTNSQSAWYLEAKQEVIDICDKLGYDEEQFAEIYSFGYTDYKKVIIDSVALFVFPFITEDENPCDDAEIEYCDCRLCFVFYNERRDAVIRTVLDDQIYSMDAVRIQSIYFDDSTTNIGPYKEGIGISVQYGHRLTYNPYMTNRYLMFELGSYSEVLDFGTHHRGGEIGGLGFNDEPYYEAFMEYYDANLTWNSDEVVNGCFPIDVQLVTREHNGEFSEDFKTIEDYERLNDTTQSQLIFLDGMYQNHK